MRRKNTLLAVAAIGLSAGSIFTVQADTPLIVRIGGHNVDPKSDNGSLAADTLQVEVDDALGLTLNFSYFLAPNVAIDVLGAVPFEHDISINGSKAGSTVHLPPTVSLQYHFAPKTSIDPFIGVGVNYTLFWEDKLDDPNTGLELDDSFGFAARIGADWSLGPEGRWVLTADLRYMDIDTDVSVNGADVGTVEIDPLAYGLALGYRYY